MSSGIEVKDECAEIFNEMKLHKMKEPARCIVFKIDKDAKTIELVKVFPKGTHVTQTQAKGERKDDEDPQKLQREEFYQITSELKEQAIEDGLYILWDLITEKGDTKGKHVLHLMNWIGESAHVKKKMLFASSKGALVKKFVGGFKILDYNEDDPVGAYEELMEKAQKK